MTNLILATLTLAGVGLDLARQVLVALGELPADWDTDPAAEAALLAHRRLADRLPVRGALEQIRHRTAQRSRRWKPWR